MLSQYDPIHLERALNRAEPASRFPPIDDRGAWQTLADNLGEASNARLIHQAETAATDPIPALPATLFLEVHRTGRREGYQNPQSRRREMLLDLVIGECLEDEGRFLDPILDVAWAICEESSWVLPAHQDGLTDILKPYLDLGVAMTALEMAEMDTLVGDRLDPLLRKRIHDELNRRCFAPYLTRHDHWWLYQDEGRAANWTAVCNAGIVGAALHMEKDPARLADILARCAHSLDGYIQSFDPDGGCSEGPGYWEYGFGYFTILADLVDWRTEGAVNFLAGEKMRQVAAYPLHTLLSQDVCVNFSDCDADVRFSQSILTYLAERLDLPALYGLAARQPKFHRQSNFSFAIRELFWALPDDTDDLLVLNHHDWFGDMMWMLARYEPENPDTLVLAAKGGSNFEMHNQNDVGNFIVHVNGESLIPDVGRGRYTKQYFGPERYDHFVNSSIGHSLPVPNGMLQSNGPDFAAELIEHMVTESEDTLITDIAGAYPTEAGLTSLRRTLTLHREAPSGWVELIDKVRFTDGPGTFESALTTFLPVEIGDEGGLVIEGLRGGLRVTYDPTEVDVRVDLHPDIDFSHGPANVYRIVFAWPEPQLNGQVRLEMVPV